MAENINNQSQETTSTPSQYKDIPVVNSADEALQQRLDAEAKNPGSTMQYSRVIIVPYKAYISDIYFRTSTKDVPAGYMSISLADVSSFKGLGFDMKNPDHPEALKGLTLDDMKIISALATPEMIEKLRPGFTRKLKEDNAKEITFAMKNRFNEEVKEDCAKKHEERKDFASKYKELVTASNTYVASQEALLTSAFKGDYEFEQDPDAPTIFYKDKTVYKNPAEAVAHRIQRELVEPCSTMKSSVDTLTFSTPVRSEILTNKHGTKNAELDYGSSSGLGWLLKEVRNGRAPEVRFEDLQIIAAMANSEDLVTLTPYIYSQIDRINDKSLSSAIKITPSGLAEPQKFLDRAKEIRDFREQFEILEANAEANVSALYDTIQDMKESDKDFEL